MPTAQTSRATKAAKTAAPRRPPAKKAQAAPPRRSAAKKPAAASPQPKPPKRRAALVRDSFTMPEEDFALIAKLKAVARAGKREARKSELLRAGLHALAGLDADALVGALGRLQPVQVGRPKKHR